MPNELDGITFRLLMWCFFGGMIITAIIIWVTIILIQGANVGA